MEWWEWVILISVLGLAGLGALTLVVQATLRGRRFLKLGHDGRIRFGRILLADPETPLPARVALIVLVGYLLLPFDIIPDFIPGIGLFDDAAVALIAITVLVALIPRSEFELALDEAATQGEHQRAANP